MKKEKVEKVEEKTKLEREADIAMRAKFVGAEIDAILKKHEMALSLQLVGYPHKIEPSIQLVDTKYMPKKEDVKINE